MNKNENTTMFFLSFLKKENFLLKKRKGLIRLSKYLVLIIILCFSSYIKKIPYIQCQVVKNMLILLVFFEKTNKYTS
tara:strand:+ start:773 stop:1003 length:231 start_codon:yes stop_codon:yes gene_type:complete